MNFTVLTDGFGPAFLRRLLGDMSPPAAGNFAFLRAPVAGGDKSPGKRRKKAGPKPSVRTVKLKDDQGNTWGGMGKRPGWFKAALASGKTPEELLAKG